MHTFFLNIAEVKILKFNFIENYQDQLFLNRGKNRTEGLKPSTVPNREILNRCSPSESRGESRERGIQGGGLRERDILLCSGSVFVCVKNGSLPLASP